MNTSTDMDIDKAIDTDTNINDKRGRREDSPRTVGTFGEIIICPIGDVSKLRLSMANGRTRLCLFWDLNLALVLHPITEGANIVQTVFITKCRSQFFTHSCSNSSQTIEY